MMQRERKRRCAFPFSAIVNFPEGHTFTIHIYQFLAIPNIF